MLILRVLSELYGLCMTYVAFICIEAPKKQDSVESLHPLNKQYRVFFFSISVQVAAGMSTVLDVEIFAVAVGVVGESGMGHVGHHIEIGTETDILYLPVTANILLVQTSLFTARHGVSYIFLLTQMIPVLKGEAGIVEWVGS